MKFCAGKTSLGDLGACLAKNKAEISSACQQELERFLLARKQAAERGGGALSSFGGLNAFGPPVPLVSYEGRFSPGQKEAPTFMENRVNASMPVYQSGPKSVAVSVAGGALHLGESLKLSTGRKLPVDLYRAEAGAQYFRLLPERKSWGLRASVGYAGDKPFQRGRDLTYSLNGHYGFPGSEKGFWLLALYLSNNSPFGNYIPLPGFAYAYRGENFSGVFGFPFLMMQWTPVFPWAFSLSAFGPSLQLEADYGKLDHIQFFTGLYWTRQSFIPFERENTKDRLTLRERKAAIGARTPIIGTALGELQLGRSSNRTAYIGHGFSDRSGGSVGLPSDWFASWSIKAKF